MRSSHRVFWSVVLSFVLVFTLGFQPNATVAASSDVTTVKVEKEKGKDKDKPSEDIMPPPTGNERGIAPLVLAPVAAYGFSSSVVSGIFAVGLGWYVGSQDLFQSSVNDKKNASTAMYQIQYAPELYPSYPDFAGFTVETSATKHMEQILVSTAANRVKHYGQSTNLRVYTSTVKVGKFMTVINITSGMGGMVNRHLGNFLSGRVGPLSNPAYKNEWMNLAGHSIFLVSDKQHGEYFHAHFIPTRLVESEIDYQRYVGQFDVMLYPKIAQDTKYQEVSYNFRARKDAAMKKRGLLKDPKDPYASIIPYK